MVLYKKESLDLLRQRIDLAEVVSSHIELKRSGSTFKALCPFHEEKTPSFLIQRGDTHYHCFGCGAHGDAIGFLMNYLKMSFVESIENLAERFGVVLERDEKENNAGPSKKTLKDCLQWATHFYHFLLLNSKEGHKALEYLYNRGIDLDFIRKFEIGFAPKNRNTVYKVLKHQGFSEEVMQLTGLMNEDRRDFFHDRILFPVRDAMGNVIGFSGRKFKEETFGGKYINTPETPLFKKSQILFGLSYCRKRITKEKKALIVEGQIDCLKLIHTGFDFAVAGQGTAFGEGHVRELIQLGVQKIYLALDGDTAGIEAAIKIGDLFQKKGAEVAVVKLPQGLDPDNLLRERGPDIFEKLMENASDYLSFLVENLSQKMEVHTPSGKNALTQEISARIRGWEQPVMVHESLRKLAQLIQVPEELIGVGISQVIRKEGRLSKESVDANKILETDLLRLLFLNTDDKFFKIAKDNLAPEQLKNSVCQRLYTIFLDAYEKGTPSDLLSCAAGLEREEESDIVLDIMSRKIHVEKAEESLLKTLLTILQRNWMEERENIKIQLYSGKLSDEEALELAKQFDILKRQIPEIKQ